MKKLNLLCLILLLIFMTTSASYAHRRPIKRAVDCKIDEFWVPRRGCRDCLNEYSFVTTKEECSKCKDHDGYPIRKFREIDKSGKGLCSLINCEPNTFHDLRGSCMPCADARSTVTSPVECEKCKDINGNPNRTFINKWTPVTGKCILKECPENYYRGSEGECFHCWDSDHHQASQNECLKCANRTYDQLTETCIDRRTQDALNDSTEADCRMDQIHDNNGNCESCFLNVLNTTQEECYKCMDNIFLPQKKICVHCWRSWRRECENLSGTYTYFSEKGICCSAAPQDFEAEGMIPNF